MFFNRIKYITFYIYSYIIVFKKKIVKDDPYIHPNINSFFGGPKIWNLIRNLTIQNVIYLKYSFPFPPLLPSFLFLRKYIDININKLKEI